MHIYLPLVCKRLPAVWLRWHVIRGAELRQHCEQFIFSFLYLHDLIPPCKMCIESFFPFRCTGIVYLWSLGVSYACMDMIGAFYRYLHGLRLICKQALTYVAPVRHIKRDS